MPAVSIKTMTMLVLHQHPECRDCDKRLYMQVWANYYPEYVISIFGMKFVMLHSIPMLPSAASIIRWRSFYNENHKYLPVSEKVAKGRQMKIGQWRKWLAIAAQNLRNRNILASLQ